MIYKITKIYLILRIFRPTFTKNNKKTYIKDEFSFSKKYNAIVKGIIELRYLKRASFADSIGKAGSFINMHESKKTDVVLDSNKDL
jgi:hypothetical protein